MIVRTLKIRNFKSIREMDIECNELMNVIVGMNGAGKSSILQVLNLLFSWITARMKNQNGKGLIIDVQDISKGADECRLELELTNGVKWSLIRQKPQTRTKSQAKTDLSDLTKYVNELVESYARDPSAANLPLIASYSVNRTVIDVPVRLRKKHELDPMAIYNIPLMAGVSFRTFFEWFREREDIENEKIRYENDRTPDKQLQAVRDALKNVLPEYGDLRVKRNPRSIVLDKNGVTFSINQLSDSEKCYLTLVADIAKRLAMANPTLENPLHGEGVVLIDEIDLHLHPSWQSEIIPRFRSTFPKCQFFLTTHSPHAISNIRTRDREKLLLLDNGTEIYSSLNPFGKTVNEVLIDFFQLKTTRNKEVQGYFDKAWDFIGNGEYDNPEFATILNWLDTHVGDSDIEIVRIKMRKDQLLKLKR